MILNFLRQSPKPEGWLPSVWGQRPLDLEEAGIPGRSSHVFQRLQRVWRWEDHHPAIGKQAQSFLRKNYDLQLPIITREARSRDGSTKVLFSLWDGEEIEAVHMPREVRSPRATLCISTQVGCAMHCAFCATGKGGWKRHLSAGEIVGQVIALMAHFGPKEGHKINLVLMGMGEPLHNTEAVIRALEILCHPKGLSLQEGRVTLSTVGLIPGLEALAKAPRRPELALSLFSVRGAQRSAMMPINKRWGLKAIREALNHWPLRHRERIIFEWVLIPGVNDSKEDALALIDWVGDLPHNINVIPYNPHDQAPFKAPTDQEVQAFLRELQDRGMRCTLRASRGQDIDGACGQLRARRGGQGE